MDSYHLSVIFGFVVPGLVTAVLTWLYSRGWIPRVAWLSCCLLSLAAFVITFVVFVQGRPAYEQFFNNGLVGLYEHQLELRKRKASSEPITRVYEFDSKTCFFSYKKGTINARFITKVTRSDHAASTAKKGWVTIGLPAKSEEIYFSSEQELMLVYRGATALMQLCASTERKEMKNANYRHPIV